MMCSCDLYVYIGMVHQFIARKTRHIQLMNKVLS